MRQLWAGGFKRVSGIVVGRAKIQIVEYMFNRVASIARSGLCAGPVQARLEEALRRQEALERDEARTESDVTAVRTELEAAYDAALDELERLATFPDRSDKA